MTVTCDQVVFCSFPVMRCRGEDVIAAYIKTVAVCHNKSIKEASKIFRRQMGVPLEPSPPITSILPSSFRSGGGPAFLGLPTKHTMSAFNKKYNASQNVKVSKNISFIF